MLDERIKNRVDAILTARWNKLESRTQKRVTEKASDDWQAFATEIDDLWQNHWTLFGPIPELLSLWIERVEARVGEIEDQLPE